MRKLETPELPIGQIKVGPRHRKDMGDMNALVASIQKLGLLHPVIVDNNCLLIAGARRLEACKRMKWKTIPVRVLDVDNFLLAEHDENEVRKNFTLSEREAIARAIEDAMPERRGRPSKQEEEEEEESDEEAAEKCHNGDTFSQGERTSEIAAKKAGFGSREELRRVRNVVANGTPELVEAMDKGEVSPSAASDVATLPREEQREVIAKGPEAVKAKAKDIRETKTKVVPAYPHSERLTRWIKAVVNETHVINETMGGIASLVGEPDKWDVRDVRNYILPMLRDLSATINQFETEISRGFEKS